MGSVGADDAALRAKGRFSGRGRMKLHLAQESDDPAQMLNLISARMGGLMLEAAQWLTVTHFGSPEGIKAAYTDMLTAR